MHNQTLSRAFLWKCLLASLFPLLNACANGRLNDAGNYCNGIGLHQGQSEYWRCVDAFTAHQPFVLDTKTLEAEQRAAKKKQLAADTAKCKEYGFMKGSHDFANCMMQLDQNRVSLSQQREQQEKQEQWQQYQAKMQSIRDMNATMQNNTPVHCYGSAVGEQINTTCY